VTPDFSDVFERLRSFSGPDADLTDQILRIVPATGASVATMGFLAAETVAASDPRAARLDEAQFDLGEGPCWDAVATRAPVLQPDLQGEGAVRWPALVQSLQGEGIEGVYAFPMAVGSLIMGAIDLYRTGPRPLGKDEVSRASAVAEVLSSYVLRRALARSGGEEPIPDESPFSRRMVHQATGYVMAQLGVSAAEAELLIRGRAFGSGRSMREIATEIIQGRHRFEVKGNMIEDGQ